jgi:hypothetical protein
VPVETINWMVLPAKKGCCCCAVAAPGAPARAAAAKAGVALTDLNDADWRQIDALSLIGLEQDLLIEAADQRLQLGGGMTPLIAEGLAKRLGKPCLAIGLGLAAHSCLDQVCC